MPKEFKKLEELNLKEILEHLETHPQHGGVAVCDCDKAFITEILKRLIDKVEALEKK
jgi:hypothetical protein